MSKDLILLGNVFPQSIKSELQNYAAQLGFGYLPASIGAFKSSERFCELLANTEELLGSNVHLVLNTGSDTNKFFTDAISTVETLKEYGAQSVHVILPFAPYARQDREFPNRAVSMMAKTFPKHLSSAGADYVTTIDMHSQAAETFYTNYFGEKNVRFLSALESIYQAVQSITVPEDRIKYGAPDGFNKPEDIAQRKAKTITRIAYGDTCDLQEWMFGITKAHTGVNSTRVEAFHGDVKGCIAVEIDDMTDTGGTLVNGAFKLKEQGAKKVIAAVTHGIFSGNSLEILTANTIDGKENPIDTLIVTDSIPGIYSKVKKLPEHQKQRVVIVPTAPLIKHALELKFN